MTAIRIFYANHFEKTNLKLKPGFRIYDDYL